MSDGSNQKGKDGRRGGLAALLGLGAMAGGLGLLMRRRPSPPRGVDPESLEAGYETRDASFGSMLGVIIALIVGILLVIAVATVFESLLTGRQGLFPFQTSITNPPKAEPPPAPRLESANGQVLDELHANEDALLNNYTWIDQQAGTVRIPIQQAMDLIVQRGLPTRAPAGGQASGGVLTMPSSASSGRQPERITP